MLCEHYTVLFNVLIGETLGTGKGVLDEKIKVWDAILDSFSPIYVSKEQPQTGIKEEGSQEM